MNSLVLAARLHGMGGAREDIRKAIESWNLEKKVIVNEQGQAVHEDSGAKEMFPRTTNLLQGEGFRRNAANSRNPKKPSESANMTGKGVDNPAQHIKDRFDRRQAGNPSMGDKMRQGFGNVKEAVGNVGARVGAAGSKALTSAGKAIGDAATAAKDKMGQAGQAGSQMMDSAKAKGSEMMDSAKAKAGQMGQATDDAMMGAARSLGRGVGTAQAKGSQMMDSAKGTAGQMGAKASEMGGGMLNAAKKIGQGAYGKIQNAASKIPGMASAAKQKAGEIGAGVMGAAGKAGQATMDMAGKAGQAAMGAGRGVMNAASQLPGQIQGAYQGAKHGSQGGANRGGAYLPGIGGRVGNFAHGLKQGGVSGLMEQGLVGTTRAGQQDRYGIGRQESKDMRRLYDSNMRDASYAQARNDLTDGQQVAYGWDPESQPAPAPGTPAPAAAGAGAAAPAPPAGAGAQQNRQLTPGNADGNEVLDSEEQKTKTTLNPDGSVKDQTTTLTQSAPSVENDPPTPDPAGGNSTGDPQPAQGGGGGNAGNIGLLGAAAQLGRGVLPGGVMDDPNGGGGGNAGNIAGGTSAYNASRGQSAFAQAAAGGGGGGSSNSNSSGNVMNVYGTPGGGAAAPAAPAAGGAAGNPALDALTANAAERAGRTGGLARNVPLGIMTGGLSNAAGGLANAWTRRGGKRDLQNLASQYRKAMSLVEIRQDIEKGRMRNMLNAVKNRGLSDREIDEKRSKERVKAIKLIEQGKAMRAGHRPLTEHQYLQENSDMGDLHERGGDRLAPFYAPHPEAPPEAPPEAAPEAAPEGEPEIERDDIVERSEPWTVVENPFVNPFYSENPFTLRKEPAPQAEIEHSIIDDYIAKDLTPESEIEVSGFDTVEGDDLSLLPASVFAKSNPVGDDMSLLPSGWNADVE